MERRYIFDSGVLTTARYTEINPTNLQAKLPIAPIHSEEPLRVAHVMGKMVGGGVESVVMNYYRHIDRDKIQFDFLVDEDSTLVPQEEIENLGGRVIVIPPYQNLLRYQKELRQLFVKEKWSIVHSHINALSVFPLYAAKKAGIPIRIAHSHSTAGKGETLRNIIKFFLKTQSNRYPTHRMACSQLAGEWLFGKNASFEFVPNAIELNKYQFDAKKRMERRKQLTISPDSFVVGHVGRFVPTKNHSFLLNVFLKICEDKQNAILLLIGDGPLRERVEKEAEKLGIKNKVLFLGHRDDICELYNVIDVFVLPSLYEGFGMVALEAQANGLSGVLSDAVTSEVIINTSFSFMPLSAGAKSWASTILSKGKYMNREIDLSSFESFDIYNASIKLSSIYLKAAK